jgi:predicted ATPase/class 3 adenylate cyclase
MIEHMTAYIPIDRRKALAQEKKLRDRTKGAALFADISGFTPLTETLSQAYGPKRGAEELIRHLNRVYDASIELVERFGGSVIGFSGDAMTCWFDKDDGLRALASALEIQKAMQGFATIAVSSQQTVALSIKVAVVVGPVRRFLVGDPSIHYIDVIAGATMDRLAAAEHQAQSGEIVIDEATATSLGEKIKVSEWRTEGNQRFAIVGEIMFQALPKTKRPGKSPELPEEQARRWLIPAVYARLKQGQGEFIAELRSAVPVFVKFSGIDYDGDKHAGAKLDAYIRWAQAIFAKYAGTLLQLTIGDKGSYIYGAFGAPIMHDDDTVRAIAAALELRRPPAELAFITNIQIGISRGRMRTGPYGGTTRRMYGIIGDETNVAARLMQQATAGQILISGHAAEAVKHRYQLHPLGAIFVKGKVEPIDVFGFVDVGSEIQPVGDSSTPVPRHAPIVGRQAERAALQNQLYQLATEHRGGTVVIVGDAGIGKSRLVEALVEQARNLGATCVVGAGDAIEQATLYHAWKPIFAQLLNLHTPADDADARRAALLSWLQNAGSELAQYAPLYSAIAPLDIPDNETTTLLSGQVRAETTRDFLARIVSNRMQSANLVIVLEDVYWLDSASWALVQRIAALSESLMLVLVTRPLGDRTPQEYQQIVSLPATKLITLGPLASDDAMELVKQRLGVQELPEPVAALIQEKADGNPFFSEEIAYALRDAKLIVINDGICELAPNAPNLLQMNFPDRVEDMIVSRIDLLSSPQQLTLKVASVIGRIFAYRTLSEIHPVREDIPQLVDYLNVLSKLDLTPLEAPDPDRSYMFKHIITQEVAYNLMLFEQRRKLHHVIGEWFEKNHTDELPNYYPTLAYHWHKVAEGADATPAVIAKAIEYLFKAGEQASQNYANLEAGIHLKNALSLLQRIPPSIERDRQELGMLTMLAYSLVTQRGYGDTEVEAAYQRAHFLSEKMPGSAQLSFVLYGIFSFHASRAEYEQGEQIANRLVEIGERLGDKPIQTVGYQSKSIVAFCKGDLLTALTHAQKSYAIAAPLDSAAFFEFGGDFQAYTSAWLALSYTLLGYPDQAQDVYEHALEITDKQPYPHCFVLGFAFIPQLKQDLPELLKRVEELVGLSQKYSFTLLGLQGNIFRAWALATTQQDSIGVQILENITPVPKFVKLDSFVPWYLSLLAEAQSAHGKYEAAVQSVDEALAYAERAGGNFYQAELYRVKGDILQAQGASSGAVEHQYRAALARARQQSARWWELRASVSLAQLLKEQGQSSEARSLLAPIFDWFTEGFQLPDLLQAKALLAELQLIEELLI